MMPADAGMGCNMFTCVACVAFEAKQRVRRDAGEADIRLGNVCGHAYAAGICSPQRGVIWQDGHQLPRCTLLLCLQKQRSQ